nr:phage terminase large subunit [Gammaproteobacteria bacterium]
MSNIDLSGYQRRIMAIPEQFDVMLGGGRGSAKSFSMALLATRHAEQYQDKARILYIRKSYKGIADFEDVLRSIFGRLYGNAARYNAAEHVWRLPNGGYLELGQLDGPGDYEKYQGRSFTLLLIDEAGQYAEPQILDLLRSNLRAPKHIPVRVVMAANPGGVGHAWLAERYIFKAEPWQPFDESKSKRQWVYAPGTYRDNPFIDQSKYEDQLRSACPNDEELLRAWLEGDWTVVRGAFFAGCIDERRNAIAPWSTLPSSYPEPWEFYLSHDYGSTAPAVTYLIAKSPGASGPDDKYYPRDSLVIVDELSTHVPGHLNQGMNYTIPRIADEIKAFSDQWKVPPSGVADDAIFANHGHQVGSIADEFWSYGVQFRQAKKGARAWGWEVMRTLLSQAGKPDVPGLYISRSCAYFWATVPYLARDPRNSNDVDSTGPDHGADAVRYGCIYHPPEILVKKLTGL